MTEDWSGAVVRLRDGRLAKVQLGETRFLAVSTEDAQLLEVDRQTVVMVAPPIGFQPAPADVAYPTTLGEWLQKAEEAGAKWWALIALSTVGVLTLVSYLAALVISALR